MRNLSTVVFLLGAAATAGVLWTMSGAQWGKREEHVVQGGGVSQIGGAKPTQVPRLALLPVKGEQRMPLEVPKEIYDQVRDADQLHIRMRSLPVLGGELIQYTLVRAGTGVVEWNEGWPFFGFTLGVFSFLGGGLLFALYRWIAAVFKFQAPSE